MALFSRLNSAAPLLLLILICYPAFFYGLGDYGLWDPDEGRSGLIAKELLTSEDRLTLTLHGTPYYDKPAFYFWLVALGLKLFGLGELAVRLPSALAATLTVAAVFLWGAVSWDRRRGLWSALVLATSMQFVALGRFGKMDMLFTLFLTAALLSFLLWNTRGRAGGWIWSFYLFVALAVLTKGPAGVVLPFLIVGGFAAMEKRWNIVLEMRPLEGLGLVVLVAAPWYLLAAARDYEYIRTFLWTHNVLRFFVVEPAVKHPEPIYYFFPILIGGFLPWTLFLPPMLSFFWREREKAGREPASFLFVWTAVILVFFSLSRNKLGVYILPAFPALALLTGDFLCRLFEAKDARAWMRAWTLGAAFFWLSFILFLSPLSDLFLGHRYDDYGPVNPPLFAAIFFIFWLGLAWLLGRERQTPWVVSFSALWLIVWFYGVKAAQVSDLRGASAFARIIDQSVPKDYRVVSIRGESLSFYLTRRVQVASHPGEVEAMLNGSEPILALVKQRHLGEIKETDSKRFFVWQTVPSEHVLVSNFPPPFGAQDLGIKPKR